MAKNSKKSWVDPSDRSNTEGYYDESKEAKPLKTTDVETGNECYRDRYGEPMLSVARSIVPKFEELRKDWVNCERCPLHAARSNVVFARGHLPADILFIGEAPGDVEDTLGFPFIGPAGRVLNTVLRELYKSRQDWTYAITNPVGCVPWDDPELRKFRKPYPEEIQACNPRFVKLLEIANPKGIVLLGKVAEDFWQVYGPAVTKTLNLKASVIHVWHPSYVLRNGGAKESNPTYRAVLGSLKQFLFQKIKVGA